jgi:uncharacterized damage-inducible protein DinB
MKFAALLLILVFSSAGQTVSEVREIHQRRAGNIVDAAERFSPADLDFKPVAGVMSVRDILEHVIESNYSLCSGIKGEKNPDDGQLEQKMKTQADVLILLKSSNNYCQSALAALTDAQLAEKQSSRNKAWGAIHLVEHMSLHYGNLVTYMRIKGLVPGETEKREAQKRNAGKN